MHQLDYARNDSPYNYVNTRVLTLYGSALGPRRLMQNALLFLLICALWGTLIYLAVATIG